MAKAKAYFVKLHPDAVIPSYGTNLSAGCDLHVVGNYALSPKRVRLLHTGLVAVPPMGYHWELVLRSSTPTKKFQGVVLANHIGVIDADYSGPSDEIKIALYNTTSNITYSIKSGDKIAQLLLRESFQPEIIEMPFEKLQERNTKSRGGFGSTGG